MHETAPDEEPGPMAPSEGKNFDLFPSFLVAPDDRCNSSSSRIRARGRGRETSWRWTETLWALFTFLEGGCPFSKEDQLALARRARACCWTSQHAHHAGLVHNEISQFVRLRSNEPLSRGSQKLSEFIHRIKPQVSDYQPGPYTLEELSQSAMYVKPDRMSLPEKAGLVDPRDHLKGEWLRAFERMPYDVPHDIPPLKPTKGCFKVEPNDLTAVYTKLIDSGVAVLIPASLALRDHNGHIVSGGLFAVPHKESTDRIILDRRPQNELERRMVMARLPHGSLFTQLIIPPNCSIRASGDDLSNYFYLLKHHEEWLGRNTVGKPIPGEWFPQYGCKPGEEYMLSFRVIAMGDTNAVDIAQETHFQILRDAGCLRSDETMAFRCILPARATWEGLYIDDHIVTQIVPKREFKSKAEKFRDDEIIANSRSQYEKLNLPVSKNKRFTKVQKFTAWGTSVDSQTGRVGAPLTKLQQLCQLILEICSLPFVTQKLLQKTVGLIVHPAMHKRIFMSLLQDTYVWINKMIPGRKHRLPKSVKEELLWVALSLPCMHSNARWQISRRIAATDASSSGGGRAATLTDDNIARTLFRFSEHRGEACRLDWSTGSLAPPSSMAGAPADLEKLMLAHTWNTTHSCSFGHKQHINILEMKMVKTELKDLVRHEEQAQRCVVLCDSRVVCGAYAKGRSSSKQLNRILRSMVGWSIAGQKSLHLLWVQSSANPSDHPSRGRKIPLPQEDDPIIRESLGAPNPELQKRRSNREIHKHSLSSHLDKTTKIADSSVCRRSCEKEHPAKEHWSFREIFAGRGNLSAVFRKRHEFHVDTPVEIIQRGKVSKQHDLLHNPTFERLCRDAKKPRQIWHFGLPCGSFSIMQNMNKGTRSSHNPEGDNSLDREKVGNELLSRTVYLCQLLHDHGSFFTIENPHSSYAWLMPQMKCLLSRANAASVELDQCQFGLRIPGEDGNLGLAKKGTRFAGTLPGLDALARKCTHDHKHVQVIGTVKMQGKWRKRSEIAGAYPMALCQSYHACCSKLF